MPKNQNSNAVTLEAPAPVTTPEPVRQPPVTRFREMAEGDKVPNPCTPEAYKRAHEAALTDPKNAHRFHPRATPMQRDQVSEKIRLESARELDIAARRDAFKYIAPDLTGPEAQALAEIEPRLSFKPSVLRDHVTANLLDVRARLSVAPS